MNSNFLDWKEKPPKRIRLIENALKKDPFIYHKKKNVISSGFNDSNNDEGQNINQELLFFQDENNKQINSLKNKINLKYSSIENNASNYLNYMMRDKKSSSMKKLMPTEPNHINFLYEQNQKYKDSFTPNKYTINKYDNINLSKYRNNTINRKNNINDYNLGNKLNISNGSNNYEDISLNVDENAINDNNFINNNNTNNNVSFLPRIQTFKGSTDITDNNYYDKISKQLIMQMNKNYMDFNKNLMIQRYSPKEHKIGNKPLFSRNGELAIPPGHIANPKYYNLGESRLKSNPIVNPGNRAPIFNYYNNHNHKLKSEFI